MPGTIPYTVIPPIINTNSPPEPILLIHGAFCCAASHLDLAIALRAHGYSPILYSRRGRLDSPPPPADYSMATEVEDALGILKETGARLIFGLSSGAMISLGIAKHLANNDEGIKLKAIAIYEPPFVDKEIYASSESYNSHAKDAVLTENKAPVISSQVRWEKKYRDQIASNDIPGAMTSAMFATQMGPVWAEYVPQSIWGWLVSKAMNMEEKRRLKESEKEAAFAKSNSFEKPKPKKGKEDIEIEGVDMKKLQKTPTLREYAPTIDYDFRLVRETAGQIPTYTELKDTPVLLMSGTKSPAYILRYQQELANTIPKCEYKIFQGEHHGTAMQKEFGGNPKVVADEMDRFFKSIKD